MSPLTRLRKGQDGKIELTTLPTAAAALVCLEFSQGEWADAYFSDGKSQQQFSVLSLDDVISVHIGLYCGESWYRWVWMWESPQEADAAWEKAPADIDQTIERIVQEINIFIQAARRSAPAETAKVVLDLTPEFEKIGWEMTLLDSTADQVAQEYRLRKKS